MESYVAPGTHYKSGKKMLVVCDAARVQGGYYFTPNNGARHGTYNLVCSACRKMKQGRTMNGMSIKVNADTWEVLSSLDVPHWCDPIPSDELVVKLMERREALAARERDHNTPSLSMQKIDAQLRRLADDDDDHYTALKSRLSSSSARRRRFQRSRATIKRSDAHRIMEAGTDEDAETPRPKRKKFHSEPPATAQRESPNSSTDASFEGSGAVKRRKLATTPSSETVDPTTPKVAPGTDNHRKPLRSIMKNIRQDDDAEQSTMQNQEEEEESRRSSEDEEQESGEDREEEDPAEEAEESERYEDESDNDDGDSENRRPKSTSPDPQPGPDPTAMRNGRLKKMRLYGH